MVRPIKTISSEAPKRKISLLLVRGMFPFRPAGRFHHFIQVQNQAVRAAVKVLTDEPDRSKPIGNLHKMGTFTGCSGTVVVMSQLLTGSYGPIRLTEGPLPRHAVGPITKSVNLSQAQGEERYEVRFWL